MTKTTLKTAPENLKKWGYDNDAEFSEQDEDLLIDSVEFWPGLLELASDPNCPKGHYALEILTRAIQEEGLRLHIGDVKNIAERAGNINNPKINNWAAFIQRLLGYLNTPFAVDELKANAMAEDLFLSFDNRVAPYDHIIKLPDVNDHWAFKNHGGAYPNYLYINKRTGTFQISQFDPLPPESLR